ncbi:hypothetical protein T440DRAFT_126209 [Plenodomus tracheiphilus IPT5]|uniref:MADS-box domain-containing protein n=1 Tax=Plenodomus tracheiphilus IPT5 TaxID=1408161 RepID=A0A6A7B412_9PLEO|nr:hypothetical protein T440DRAFT_126209 [Plenodomus tracheiphilus IPT5]
MPKAQPQNPSRTFKTRTTGIFKKASYLHEFDESIRIAIFIEKPGSAPLVFTSEEDGISWPPLLQDYVARRGAMVKRPSHYVSLNEGLSRGRVRVVDAGASSPPPPYMREETPDQMDEEELNDQGEDGSPPSYLPVTPRGHSSFGRNSSPLPIPFVLPSKMTLNDAKK